MSLGAGRFRQAWPRAACQTLRRCLILRSESALGPKVEFPGLQNHRGELLSCGDVGVDKVGKLRKTDIKGPGMPPKVGYVVNRSDSDAAAPAGRSPADTGSRRAGHIQAPVAPHYANPETIKSYTGTSTITWRESVDNCSLRYPFLALLGPKPCTHCILRTLSVMNFYPVPPTIQAELYVRVPDDLRCHGRETEWRGGFARPFQNIFLEGPVADESGNLYVVDIPYGRILKIDAAKEITLVAQWDGEPNGLAATQDGSLVIADYKQVRWQRPHLHNVHWASPNRLLLNTCREYSPLTLPLPQSSP